MSEHLRVSCATKEKGRDIFRSSSKRKPGNAKNAKKKATRKKNPTLPCCVVGESTSVVVLIALLSALHGTYNISLTAHQCADDKGRVFLREPWASVRSETLRRARPISPKSNIINQSKRGARQQRGIVSTVLIFHALAWAQNSN